ncbi:hypothetical protein ACJX0J_021704, partial [Zea mays]
KQVVAFVQEISSGEKMAGGSGQISKTINHVRACHKGMQISHEYPYQSETTTVTVMEQPANMLFLLATENITADQLESSKQTQHHITSLCARLKMNLYTIT